MPHVMVTAAGAARLLQVHRPAIFKIGTDQQRHVQQRIQLHEEKQPHDHGAETACLRGLHVYSVVVGTRGRGAVRQTVGSSPNRTELNELKNTVRGGTGTNCVPAATEPRKNSNAGHQEVCSSVKRFWRGERAVWTRDGSETRDERLVGGRGFECGKREAHSSRGMSVKSAARSAWQAPLAAAARFELRTRRASLWRADRAETRQAPSGAWARTRRSEPTDAAVPRALFGATFCYRRLPPRLFFEI